MLGQFSNRRIVVVGEQVDERLIVVGCERARLAGGCARGDLTGASVTTKQLFDKAKAHLETLGDGPACERAVEAGFEHASAEIERERGRHSIEADGAP